MCIALSWGVFSCVMMVHSDPYYTMHTTRIMVRIKMSRCELRKEPHLVQVVTLNYLIHRVTKISSTAVNT